MQKDEGRYSMKKMLLNSKNKYKITMDYFLWWRV